MKIKQIITVSCIWTLQIVLISYILYVGPRYVSGTKQIIRDIGKKERLEKLQKTMEISLEQERRLISLRDELAALIESTGIYSVSTSSVDLPNNIKCVTEYNPESDLLIEVKKITPLIVSKPRKFASLNESLDAARSDAQRILNVSESIGVELYLMGGEPYFRILLAVQNNINVSGLNIDRQPWITKRKIGQLREALPKICNANNFNCHINNDSFAISISMDGMRLKTPIDKSQVQSALQSSINTIDAIQSYMKNELTN